MINMILIACIQVLRPMLGPAYCKYSESCGNYAMQQLKSEPIVKALWAICKRLILCNPFNKNTY